MKRLEINEVVAVMWKHKQKEALSELIKLIMILITGDTLVWWWPLQLTHQEHTINAVNTYVM